MRKEGMENLVTTGYVYGRGARGRQMETYLPYLKQMKEKTPIENNWWRQREHSVKTPKTDYCHFHMEILYVDIYKIETNSINSITLIINI